MGEKRWHSEIPGTAGTCNLSHVQAQRGTFIAMRQQLVCPYDSHLNRLELGFIEFF